MRTTQMTSEFLCCLAARSRRLCALSRRPDFGILAPRYSNNLEGETQRELEVACEIALTRNRRRKLQCASPSRQIPEDYGDYILGLICSAIGCIAVSRNVCASPKALMR